MLFKNLNLKFLLELMKIKFKQNEFKEYFT